MNHFFIFYIIKLKLILYENIIIILNIENGKFIRRKNKKKKKRFKKKK